MDNLMQLINMAQKSTAGEKEAAELLAVFGPPPKDFKPQMNLPVQNDLPSFSLGQAGIGGQLSGQNHGVAAPMFGRTEGTNELSLGELLTGENNAAAN